MDNITVKKYANFVVRCGVNVQKGQTMLIQSPVETAWFARLCAEEAYAAGAREVAVHYGDEKLDRINIEFADVKALETVRPWVLASRMEYYENDQNLCRLAIYAEDPEIFKGLDLDRVDRAANARGKALKPWMELSMANRMQWCVVSVPTQAWAQKVFPGQPDAATEKLWQAICKVTRMDADNPANAWSAHAEASKRREERLNGMNLAALRFTDENGTDLMVGLVDGYRFDGITNNRVDGLPFFANIPSEELFTAPHREKVNGVVKSSLPYVYNGNLIEGITAHFEDGVAVDVCAEKGDTLLRQMMSADEGARRLGEIALVPASSLVRKSGVLFYNGLYDENAACHMAFGAGYPTNVRGSAQLSRAQLTAKGLNDSLIHEDIMIGTEKMDVTGILCGGGEVAVFRDGEWAL